MHIISVIVPIFNVEKHIDRCINSILCQTFKDFEVLLIDDGSTDTSGSICDEYAKMDNRIKVFHKQNEGISATRQFGFENAEGDYIQYIDSDDWIEPNMLELMYNKAISTKSDIVGCNFIQEFENKSIKTKATYDTVEAFRKAVISNYWGVVWKLLIKKNIITNNCIQFPKGIDGGEDYCFVVNLSLSTSCISFVDMFLYHYNRKNNTSFINTPSFKKLFFQVEATNKVEDKIKEINLELLYHNELTQRKGAVKRALLINYLTKSYRIYPEIDSFFVKKGRGIKNKVYFLLSLILNKLHI